MFRGVFLLALAIGLWTATYAASRAQAQEAVPGENRTDEAGKQEEETRDAAKGEAEPASAGDASTSADAVARGLFQAGAAAYDAGRYEEALEHFQAAYQRSPRPELLFNIAQSADRLRLDERALEAFRRYLEALPNAENRAQVENRIRALEEVLHQREEGEKRNARAEHDEPASQARPTRPEPSPKRSAEPEDATGQPLPLGPVLTAGAGVTVLGLGIAFGFMAADKEDTYANATIASEGDARTARHIYDDAEVRALAANVLIGIGAAAMVGGALWYILDASEQSASPAVRAVPVLAPRYAGVAVAGRVGGPW